MSARLLYFVVVTLLATSLLGWAHGSWSVRMLDMAIVAVSFNSISRFFSNKNGLQTVKRRNVIFCLFLFTLGVLHIGLGKSTIWHFALYNRRWLMLLFAQDLMSASREERQAFLRTILVLTTLQSLVYIFQNLTGLNVTFWSDTIETMTGLQRFTVKPALLYFTVFALLTRSQSMALNGDAFDGIGESRMRWCTAINLVAMLYTGSLGLIASVLVASVVVVIKARSALRVASLALMLLAILYTSDFMGLKSKLDYASSEVKLVEMEDRKYFNNSSSAAFRLAMLVERMDFLAHKDWHSRMFGHTFQPDGLLSKQIFDLGTPSKGIAVGREQYDSVDIAYVGGLMRYGYVGILAFLGFLATFLAKELGRRLGFGIVCLVVCWSFSMSMFFLNPFHVILFLTFRK